MLFEAENLSYRYADGTTGLSGVNLQIEQGQSLAILGANGSGKSTLLRILNGLLEPTSGTVLFEGRPLCEHSLKESGFHREFRSRVGFVFQDADAQLFNATVAEEVAFGPAQLGLSEADVKLRVTDTLQFLGIRHLADRAPFRLSGGEKRKVAIACVLSMNPDAILLDEPLIGLDPRSQGWLIHTLNQLQAAGKTTIIATHSLTSLAQIAEQAIVLSEDHRLISRFDTRDRDVHVRTLLKANLISESQALASSVL